MKRNGETWHLKLVDLGVSENRGTPKSSILIGFSIINHPFLDTSIFGKTYLVAIYISTNPVGHPLHGGFRYTGISPKKWPKHSGSEFIKCPDTR